MNHQKVLTLFFTIYFTKIAWDDYKHREVWLWDLLGLGLICLYKFIYQLPYIPWSFLKFFFWLLVIYSSFLLLLIQRTRWLSMADGYVLLITIITIIINKTFRSYGIIIHFLSQWIVYSIGYMIYRNHYRDFPAITSLFFSWVLILVIFGL